MSDRDTATEKVEKPKTKAEVSKDGGGPEGIVGEAQKGLGNDNVAQRGGKDRESAAEKKPEGTEPGEPKKRPDPKEPGVKPTTQDVEAEIDAGSGAAAILQKIAELAKQDPDWPFDCWQDAGVMTKLKGALDGAQMLQALTLLDQPAANRTFEWLECVAQAHIANGGATASTFQDILVTTSEADQLDLIARHAHFVGWFKKAGLDPLTTFRTQQAGLDTTCASSKPFLEWMIDKSASPAIARAIFGTGLGDLPTLTGHLNTIPTGWIWLLALKGSELTVPQRATLTEIGKTIKAGMLEKDKVDALVKTKARAPKSSSTLLAEVKSWNTTQRSTKRPVELLARIQAAPLSERIDLVKDKAELTWASTKSGAPAMMFMAVMDAEQGDFLEQPNFAELVVNNDRPEQTITLFCKRSIINKTSAMFNANDALCGTWIGKLGVTKSPMLEMDLRAMSLLLTSATRKSAIGALFADETPPDAWATKASAPLTAGVADTPLVTLKAELATPAPDVAKVERLVGALGEGRSALKKDATSMGHLKAKLSGAKYAQVLKQLEYPLKDELNLLIANNAGATELRQAIDGRSLTSRKAAAGDDAVVAGLETAFSYGPFELLGLATLDDRAEVLNRARVMTWFTNRTTHLEILRVAGESPASAQRMVPLLDRHAAWGWLAGLPRVPALTPTEQQQVKNLVKTVTDRTTRKQLEAKLDDPDKKQWAKAEQKREKDAKKAKAPQPSPVVAEIATELGKPKVDAAVLVDLTGRLTKDEDRLKVKTDHLADMLNKLTSYTQIARILTLLRLPLYERLELLKSLASVTSRVLAEQISTASKPEQLEAFDSAAAIAHLRDDANMSPLMVFAGLTLADVDDKPTFWKWLAHRGAPLDVLKTLSKSKGIISAFDAIITKHSLTWLDNVPRCQALPPEARKAIDTLIQQHTDGPTMKALFAVRWDLTMTGPWAQATKLDDLRMLNAELKTLPIAHVAKHPKIAVMERTTAGGGSYNEGSGTVKIGATPTEDGKFYEGSADEYTEKYFDHTVRHEVGHAVDALLGGKTDLVFGTAGWKEYGLGEIDGWLTSFDAWSGALGGKTLGATEKGKIKDVILEYVQAGGGTIEGPGLDCRRLVADDHPYAQFPGINIVRDLDAVRSAGLGYVNRVTRGGKTFSINFYYRRFMECKASAADAAPRDYCMFAPAEWFADMYAEYYREFDGVDDSKLGGNCPAYVKSWMKTNVHTIGGRSPHDVKGLTKKGKKVPVGKRVNH